MSDVDEMIGREAKYLWEEYVQCPDGATWDDIGQRAKTEWLAVAKQAIEGIGIPLETLAALKAGTWQAVPVVPTDEMLRAENKPGMGTDEIWAAMLTAAPTKPGDE